MRPHSQRPYGQARQTQHPMRVMEPSPRAMRVLAADALSRARRDAARRQPVISRAAEAVLRSAVEWHRGYYQTAAVPVCSESTRTEAMPPLESSAESSTLDTGVDCTPGDTASSAASTFF
eukprot:7361665-Prymnesium_polylepis.1